MFGFESRKRDLKKGLDAHLCMGIADRIARGESPAERALPLCARWGICP